MTTTTFGNNWAIPVRRRAARSAGFWRNLFTAMIDSRDSQVRRELARRGLLPETLENAPFSKRD